MYVGNKIYALLTTALRWRWHTSVSLRKLQPFTAYWLRDAATRL